MGGNKNEGQLTQEQGYLQYALEHRDQMQMAVMYGDTKRDIGNGRWMRASQEYAYLCSKYHIPCLPPGGMENFIRTWDFVSSVTALPTHERGRRFIRRLRT